MKPPDPKEAARTLEIVRATNSPEDDEWDVIEAALEFYARKPDLYLAADDHERIEANEELVNLPEPEDGITFYVCYRLQEATPEDADDGTD